MSLELTIKKDTMEQMENVLDSCSLVELSKLSAIQRQFTLTRGMSILQGLFSGPVLKEVLALKESNLGFRTDRPPGTKSNKGQSLTYQDNVIRDALLEGLIRGAYFVNNEINVIGSKCYLTKEYFERVVRTYPGVTNLEVTQGVPVLNNNRSGALVTMIAAWEFEGEFKEMRCEEGENLDSRIVVRVNEGMGTDAILGKAMRKLMARIFARLTNTSPIEARDDIDDPKTVDATSVSPTEDTPQAEEQDIPDPPKKPEAETKPAVDPLLDMADAFANCKTVGAIGALEKAYLEMPLSQDQAQDVIDGAELAVTRLERGRGEQSNQTKSQKNLA